MSASDLPVNDGTLNGLAPLSTPAAGSDAGLGHPSKRPPTTASIIRELAIVSLIIAPLAIIPLVPLRRGMRQIAQQVSEIKAIQSEALRQSSMSQGRGLKVLDETRTALIKHREESGVRIGTMFKEIGALQKALEEVRAGDDKVKRELSVVRMEVKAVSAAVAKGSATVNLSSQTLDEMASSLVDIAAFIEEVETLEGLERRGTDPRGVEKIRKLALKLHSMAGSATQDLGRPA